MINPVSTYRVQLSPDFTFEDLQEIVDYLEDFGISTIYSAPFFQAREGSTHGYDITNPFGINRAIGRLEIFRNISRRLQQKGMSWLQDIVPNHMAFDGENVWLQDIFELGPESKYYNFFDINWEHNGHEKVMAPFLGSPLNDVLQKKELKLNYSKKGFFMSYFDHEYPVSAQSYVQILKSSGGGKWEEKFRNFSAEDENWQELKEFFVREVEKDQDLREEVLSLLDSTNSSEEKLKEILELQHFLPVHWKKTEEEINYRRFFTINDLICLRMEDRKVYENYHRFILQLCEEKLINGLRIDHIDGLFDPKAYLENLRRSLGNDFYIIIEKILEWDEKLPVHWPVQGTSGYGFLAAVNELLTDVNSEKTFEQAYHQINPANADYADLVYKQKLFILKERMGGEYTNLWEMAFNLDLLPSRHRTDEQKQALGSMLAAFPVYRIYPEEYPLRKKQRKIIETAYDTARDHASSLKKELDLWKNLFLGEADGDKENMLFFLQRCQQFTGPLAAKGAEDTSFYIYNKLISHNEVGDSPENFGLSVDGFHQKMKSRKEDFPLSVNATATHDTKRGEDARMRINVLSEIGEEWFQKVEEWKQIGKKIRTVKDAPDANEEYFIFQMLIGAWPFEGKPGEEFLQRSADYLQKVLREAKEHSSWAAPDEDYETAVQHYLKTLIQDDNFQNSFSAFHDKIKRFGAIKSLSQSVLKLTCPGIPDVYQGTELWDLSYVDPDNRRPVDYSLRKEFLKEIDSFSSEDILSELDSFKQNYTNGKIKMYTLHRGLNLRKQYPEVFDKGEYLPLEVEDAFKESLIAFARKHEDQIVIIVAPVVVSRIFNSDLQLRKELEEKILIKMPEDFPPQWRHIYSNKELNKELRAADLFKDFPVALLTNNPV